MLLFSPKLPAEGILNPQDQDLLPSAIKYGQGWRKKMVTYEEAFKVECVS